MSESLGASLPPDLLGRLGQADLASHLGKALPLITVDAAGRPHPMLLSYLEVRAHDPRTIAVVINARSRSARNLLEREVATLLLVEADRTIYVKCRARAGPDPLEGFPDFGRFVLGVEDVLEDAPGAWEGGLRITGGIHYAPAPPLDAPWVRATLRALAVTPER